MGGTNAPSSLNWALAEFVQGANPALWTYVGVPTAARVVWKHGTERDLQDRPVRRRQSLWAQRWC